MADNGKFNRDMKRFLKEAQQLISYRLPGIIKVEGLDFIHDNFDAQGFNTGTSVQRWQSRKPPKNMWRKRGKTVNKGTSQQLRSTKAGSKFQRDANRALLVKRGHLRRSWDSDTKATDAQVAFRNTLPYAEPHNEGLKPQLERKQIGDSANLDNRIMAKIDREMQRLLNP